MESFGVTSLGVVYEFNEEEGGVLLDSGTGSPGSFEQIAPGNTHAFAMSPTGAAYALGVDGVLRYNSGSAGGNCTQIADDGVVSFAFAPDGTRYELGTLSGLWRQAPGGSFQAVDTGVEAFGVTSLGVVYDLNQEQGGVLLGSGTGNPGSFVQLAAGQHPFLRHGTQWGGLRPRRRRRAPLQLGARWGHLRPGRCQRREIV